MTRFSLALPCVAVEPFLSGTGAGAVVSEVVTHVNFCEFIKVLNSLMSDWELVKPIPCPASTKYPRMSPAFHFPGLAFRKRIGTTLLVSCRYTTRGGSAVRLGFFTMSGTVL